MLCIEDLKDWLSENPNLKTHHKSYQNKKLWRSFVVYLMKTRTKKDYIMELQQIQTIIFLMLLLVLTLRLLSNWVVLYL